MAVSLCIVLMLTMGSLSQRADSIPDTNSSALDSDYYYIPIGIFDYTISFVSEAGVELLRLGCMISMRYAHPDAMGEETPQHRMTVTMGFHRGHSILGRPLVTEMRVNVCSFYSRWSTSLGETTDLFMNDSMFDLRGEIPSGHKESVTKVTERDAATRHVIMFGGTLHIEAMSIVLSNSEDVSLDMGPLDIVMEKLSEESSPQPAVVSYGGNLSYLCDSNRLVVNLECSTPWIQRVDLVLSLGLLGIACVATVVIVSKWRKR